jgi:hypothetical protein
LTLTCPTSHRIIAGCSFCIIQIPCACTLSTETQFYPSAFESCTNNTGRITRLHPINLAFLQHFFDVSTLDNITGDTTFLNPVTIANIPNINIYSNTFSKYIARDGKDHLSLERVAAQARNGQTIVKYLSESILDAQISWTDTTSIITLISVTMSTICIMICMYLLFRLKTLSTSIVLLSKPTVVHSLHNIILDYNTKMTTTITPNVILDYFSDFHDSVMLGILGILLLLILFYLIFGNRKRNTNCLAIELTTGKKCVILPILLLSVCPSYWDITAPTSIHNLRIDGYIRPTLSLDWPDFAVKSKISQISLHIPDHIRISFATLNITTIFGLYIRHSHWLLFGVGHWNYAYG